MRCWSIAGLPPALNSPVRIYTPGWRELLRESSVLPKNATHYPRPGARFSKAPETFRARKDIFSPSESKNGEVLTPETFFVKGTSLHIKNMGIKQPCNRKVCDFTIALRARKVSGTFEKRVPGPEPGPLDPETSALTFRLFIILSDKRRTRFVRYFVFQIWNTFIYSETLP